MRRIRMSRVVLASALSLASLLIWASPAKAIVIEHVPFSAQFATETSKESEGSRVSRAFNLPLQIQAPSGGEGGFLSVLSRAAGNVTINQQVVSSGQRSTAVTLFSSMIQGGVLFFNFRIQSNCKQLNTSISGNINETLCVPAVSVLPLNVEFPDTVTVLVKRGAEPGTLDVKFHEGFLEQYVAPTVEAALATAVRDTYETCGTGLNMNTSFAQAFSQHTRDVFIMELSHMAHDKGAVQQQALPLALSVLGSQTFSVPVGTSEVAELLTDWTSAAFSRTSQEPLDWELHIYN